MSRIRKVTLPVCLTLLIHAQSATADGADNGQLSLSHTVEEAEHSPRTNAERRHDGAQHQLTPWLTASTLVELEWRREEFSVRGSGDYSIRERSATFQLGLSATPWKFLKGELNLEYDTAISRMQTDEAFIVFEMEEWELQVGKMYTPFGEYVSHFPSGPLLEVGETRANGISLSYGPSELFDFSVTAYRGQARQIGGHSSRTDWVAAVATNIDDRYLFGLSYQSDLADANGGLLADEGDRFERKVAAASGYFIWSEKEFELSFELLGALDSYRELNPDYDQPLAWNLEFVHFINPDFEWALRAEGSRELKGEPEWQLGTAFTWHVNRSVSCSVEYLHGHFNHGLATNQAEDSYDSIDRIGVQISLGF